jgi:integrase
MQHQTIPHRTDQKRGKRVRVAPGVFERAGKYLISYTDAEGVDHLETLGPVKKRDGDGFTLTEAKAARERKRVNVRSGASAPPRRETVNEMATDFFAMFESLVSRGESSERTLGLYRQHYGTHIEKTIGRKRVQALRGQDISQFLSELRKKRKRTRKGREQGDLLSDHTIRGIYSLLNTILNHAVTRGLINESPARRLSKNERPKARDAKEPRILAHEEIAALLNQALPAYRALLSTAIFTGMRQSELLGLRWQDIDLREGFIRVRHQLTRATTEKPARLAGLKTAAGRRDIVLLPQLGELLRLHRAAALELGHAGGDDYVFATEIGTPMYYRNVTKRGLDKAANRAGLNHEGVPKLTLHDLRHTFASHLIVDLGVDVVQVSRQLGHSKPSVTLDVYAGLFAKARHAEDIRQRMASSAFGALLG